MDFRRRIERCSKNDDLSCYCLFYPAPELLMGPKPNWIISRGTIEYHLREWTILIINWGITVGFKMDFHLKKCSKL